MPMADSKSAVTSEILKKQGPEIRAQWAKSQEQDLSLRNNLLKPRELEQQTEEFLAVMGPALSSAPAADPLTSEAWAPVREFLSTLSRSRARQGFTPTETATFVFSLKQPLFDALAKSLAKDPARFTEEMWAISTTLDRLGLFTSDTYQKGREEVISRQQQELMELSTPVVQLWDGILALPLIGTLDSARTQVVMESLLQAIVDTGSEIAIIDITGVPVVDTLVAQHLLKTVAAARLMGADCIISGIRPQIAQTIVHLGVDISAVLTKATLAAAFAIALTRLGLAVQKKSGSSRAVPPQQPDKLTE
jgi:rsbT co-antagonist protein RsbR